jgi:hypothetical protein
MIDQESAEMAHSYYQLGKAIHSGKGDMVKSETLARVAFRLKAKLFDSSHSLVGVSASLLANI